MSTKQFETFLTEHFLKESADSIQAGYRYQFQSPDSENSKKLHQAFIALSQSKINVKGIAINVLTCGQVNLIPVLHSENGEGFSENFISHLRDEVAGQQGQLKGTALLVIHNSMLDTLINSAEDVAQPGCVWHAEVIKESMKSLIDYHDDSHQVSECLLEHRFKQILDDGATMFGFVELYKALLDGDLKFGELGLLEDPAILNWSGKQEQINERLDKNKKLYEKLDFITHHFPNELDEKLAEINFSEKFISKNFGGDKPERWRTELELGDCFQEQAKNLNNSLELETETLKQGELISRNKSESKTGMRDRQLILVLEPEQTEFNLELSFLGGSVDKKQCVIQHNKLDDISVTTRDGDKRSKVKVLGQFNQQPLYFSLILKREKTAERFKFRVLVLPANEFYIDSFRHCYLIEPNKNRITLQTEDNSFCIAEQGNQAKLEEVGDVFETETISEIDFEQVANESDRLHFIVKSNNSSLTFNVEGAIATDSLTLPLLLDQDRFVRLYQNDYFGTFKRAEGKLSKIILDNKEVAPKGRRLTLLQWEADLVDNQLLTRKDDETACVYLQNIEGDYAELYLAYRNIFNFCVEHKTLPSILGWGSNFRALVSDVVTSYLQAIEEIGIDIMLSKAQKRLVNIGFSTYNDEELITPFHPLNLAYYLNLANNIVADEEGSFKGLPKVTISRLNAQGLLPFIYDPVHGFSYNQLEKDNCFWLKLVPQQDTSYAYVRKLVKEKVGEFKDAFSALFNAGGRSTLIINSVNNQKNHELFLGLVDYVKNQKDKVCQIHVNLYDDKLSFTEFDKFAETASYDEIKALYELDKGAIREQADTIIDLLRTRLTYSKFENRKTTEQAYAHLSFFRNNNKVEPTDVNVAEELSGVVCHGLLAGEAAASKEDSYFTGFGLKGVDTKSLPHLRVAKSLASLIKPSRKSNEQHSLSKSMALAVSDSFKTLLERSYQSSIWTTIIDPKVTLDFFENATDLVLIHYSDNYTNSVNYDAITVSKQTELYKKVLEQDEGGITEEFNAFNGEWLLKMIKADGDARKNENDRKEKKGIIGAYKFVNCLLSKSDITWVPLSVAEMIRVAGNIGLKMSDSDFSRNVQGYKSGVISDDVLFVGFKNQQIYLLPLEVKTGVKQTHNKGVQQAKELKRYLTEDILGRQDFAGGLYRGLFIRQVLMQVDKYKLYNLYQKDYFTDFTNQREWWLQGDYSLAEINNYPEGFLVSHVENDTFFEAEFTEVENILKIQLPISYLRGFVSTPLQELMHDVCPEKLCYIPKKYILNPGVSYQEIQCDKKNNTQIQNNINQETYTKDALNEEDCKKEILVKSDESLKSSSVIQNTHEGIVELPEKQVSRRTLVDELIIPDDIKLIIERVRKYSGSPFNVQKLMSVEEYKLEWQLDITPKMVTSFKVFKAMLNDAVSGFGPSTTFFNESINDSPAQIISESTEVIHNKLNQPQVNKTNIDSDNDYAEAEISKLQPTDICEGDWDDILEFTNKKNPKDAVTQLAAIKFQMNKFYAVLDTKLDGYHKEVVKIKENADWLYPGDYESQLQFVHDEISKIKSPNAIPGATDLKTVSTKISTIETHKPAEIDDSDWEEILLFAKELKQRKQIAIVETVKKQVSFYNEIKELRLKEPHEKLNQFESIIAEAEITYPSDYEKQYRFIKVQLDNRVTESPVLSIPTDIPKDIAENIVKAAKEAYFDDKEMFDIFIKEQTEAFLAIATLKPADMPDWSWDTLVSHTEQIYIDDFSGQFTEIKKHISAYNDIENMNLPGARQKLHDTKQEARELHPGDYCNQLKVILNEWKKLEAIHEEMKGQLQARAELIDLNIYGINTSDLKAIKRFSEDTCPDDFIGQKLAVHDQAAYHLKVHEIVFDEHPELLQEVKDDADKLSPGDYESQFDYINEQLEKFKLEQIKEQITPVIKPKDTLKVLIGHSVQNEQPILWEPTNTAKFMNTNSGIIGTMGTGKTQCTKSVVTQLYRNQHNNVDGKPIGILIFDYKSDYVDDKFIEATQGKKFNLHKLPYNPLSLFGDTPMLPVHTARGFSETMGRAFGLGQKQTLKLRKLIGEAYDLAGIKKGDPSTWLKPAPTIADVWALFEESEPTEDSLYAALESLHELEIFETDITKCTSLYELVDGITVIELAGYPGEIQNLVVALTLDLFYSQMQKQGKPEVQGDFRQVTKLLLVDEADNFMSQNFPSLRKVLKEGREYGVGVILSTQDITHFKTSENDYSAYILSWIVHRVGQIKNQDIKSIFNKDDKADQEQLMKSIRELDKHYSLYVDGDKKVQKIKDKAFWEL
jgi:DNA phosphorothioation-dependent restriction protein DptH